MSEKNYDFRKRHWQYHKPDRRNFERCIAENEVMIDESWAIGYDAPHDSICDIAVKDFRDYLETSMNLSLRIVREKGEKVFWIEVDNSLEKGFVLDVRKNSVTLSAAEDSLVFRATIHIEDMMNALNDRLAELNSTKDLSEFEQGRQCAYEEMMDIIRTRHKIIMDVLEN